LEYFCFEGDDLWTRDDRSLMEMARQELETLGLARAREAVDGSVVRMPKAYPVYDTGYQEAVAEVRRFLTQLPNLQLVGRNGMHKYNNQDHSMLTAMLAVENIKGAQHDMWRVNADSEYLEEVRAGSLPNELAAVEATQPAVPVAMQNDRGAAIGA
jgi:hypothetical protein